MRETCACFRLSLLAASSPFSAGAGWRLARIFHLPCLQMCRGLNASWELQGTIQKLIVPAPPFLHPHAAAAAQEPPISPVA